METELEQEFKTRDMNLSACLIVEGIEYLRKFSKIHIHQRCKHTEQEFKLYCYKIDAKTGEILPIIVDKNNHYKR